MWPGVGLEGTMNRWLVGSGIPRRTLCANCAAPMSWLPEGSSGEEIAAELNVSAATLYNWRRTYGGMDTDAAKELKELREQNGRLKRLLAGGRAGEGRATGGGQGKILSPAAKRRAVDMLGDVERVGAVGVQGRWAGPLHLPKPADGADSC